MLTGLANVGVLCTEASGAATGVVEGRNFMSGFVAAHELGHTMGMMHDGEAAFGTSDCGAEHNIMSGSTGSGRVELSVCSAHAFRNHLRGLFLDDRLDRCFKQNLAGSEKGFEKDLRTGPSAGQLFNSDEQCQFSYGKGYKADFTATSSICPLVHCTHNFWQVQSHPALPGTTCANNKRCDHSARCVLTP